MSDLIQAAWELCEELRDLSFSAPVACVYQPLEYAWKAHELYLKKFGTGSKRVLFLGMNPGPFGMAQTGVPFGEISAVRDWMKVVAPIDKPKVEHPKRPIEGFSCQRSEVSGRRLWGLFQDRFESADAFFTDHFVANYCPLVWMCSTGANITPNKLPVSEMAPVEAACQRHLVKVIECLEPKYLIGVGAFAEERVAQAAATLGTNATIGKVLHPSPASPAANRGWAEAATQQLLSQGVWG